MLPMAELPRPPPGGQNPPLQRLVSLALRPPARAVIENCDMAKEPEHQRASRSRVPLPDHPEGSGLLQGPPRLCALAPTPCGA
jgi:hypothetical protein